ncbi:MAG: hypothetical protein HC827_18310 [Cyanobacteria bacterium RM1_2_2]|nr:hypothetical protein [Cyanobacteria bacterium RM1_2_2]
MAEQIAGQIAQPVAKQTRNERGAVIHSNSNPDDGKATAPRLFLEAGAIRRMRQAFAPSWMTRPRTCYCRSLPVSLEFAVLYSLWR